MITRKEFDELEGVAKRALIRKREKIARENMCAGSMTALSMRDDLTNHEGYVREEQY